ncbi:MAG: hypothetical protein E6K81_07000 [Candidatus Eisenbacteria bacterium]|uniref:HEAT repeat domain-containing protein n=1 Tax=Eiseniibacteriota bacterium TaxID=2212470 RepID=A0A538U9N7_UNCEI|nr:MAG: hypothetical protein E6K81_07000 [Candidatus Eisenbacteria bacterium]
MTRPGEPDPDPAPVAPARGPRPPSPLTGAVLSGALLLPLLAVALAALLGRPGPWAQATLLEALLARALSPTGWAGLPLLGAGLGALVAARGRVSPARVARALALGLALDLAGILVLARAAPALDPNRSAARGARAKAQEILRASFRSPEAVREQAVLALGVNLVVAGVEHATPERPSRMATLPLRDSLRVRLLAALTDRAEGVRAEAARALWKAPKSFGPHPEAAETLAAFLDRAGYPQAVERFAWLALDAAAGAKDPRLRAAAARFAATTPDSDLARAARLAVGR